ncbi:hypothetical protein L6258_02720, partial [Candidatus Parcubacteria bacterium]|nr:hypothetical protein [Candidatus Parcubacteria bacterium]
MSGVERRWPQDDPEFVEWVILSPPRAKPRGRDEESSVSASPGTGRYLAPPGAVWCLVSLDPSPENSGS